MIEHTNQTELNDLLSRLDADSTSDLIRDVIRAIKSRQGRDSLLSDPWEDMDIGVDFPDFYIENFRLPLIEMKEVLYKRLEIIRQGSNEYKDDIEDVTSASLRIGYLLKFKQVKDGSGTLKNICESLTESHRPLCFIQLCGFNNCNYLIKHIDRAVRSKSYNRRPFKDKRTDILIEIDPPWFKIGNLSNRNYMGIGLESAKQLIQEWIDFINA